MKNNIIYLICVIVNNAQAHGVWVSLRKTRNFCIFFHFVLWKLCRSQRCPTGLRRSPVHQIPRNVLGPIASLERNVSHTNSEAAITNKTCGVTKNSRLNQSDSSRLEILPSVVLNLLHL